MAATQDLTSDIQRALHHAVIEANSAYTDHVEPKKKKKKKKRPRDNDDDPTIETHSKKRKKNKKRDIEESSVQECPAAVPQLTITPDVVIRSEGKKKSKEKGKGKEAARQADIHGQTNYPQIDPQLAAMPSTSQASASAFLSAIVAASGWSESQPSQPNLQHSQFQNLSQPPNYLPYQPHANYPYQTPFLPMSQSSPTMFPGLSDLPFESNEDVLHAFQDLDLTKIANVLKTLGEAAAAANVPLGGTPSTFMPPPPPPHEQVQVHAPLNQVPIDSAAVPEKSKDPGHRRRIDMTLPGPEQHVNPEHAEWLANKWMSATKLAELVKTHGLVYKKGKFSAVEEQQLKDAMDTYCQQKNLSAEELHEVIFSKSDKSKDNAFWSEITAAVPQRPLNAVYHHVRRSFHPMKQQGKWSQAEDGFLKQAVAEFGQQWEKVSVSVGRMASDCRDRYRNHIANREMRVNGHWTKEEEDELTKIVTEMTIKQGKDLDDVFWGQVSDLMGNRRGRQQCRIKWTDSLSKTVKNEGQKPRWSQYDAYILVHKIDNLKIRDDTEIDWKTLLDPSWNLWSPHSLQRRWLTMKRSVKGFEDMTHQEIMDILRVKKAQAPAQPTGKTKPKRKVTSAAAVIEAEDEAEEPPPVGSSTGLGTLAQAEALRSGNSGVGLRSG